MKSAGAVRPLVCLGEPVDSLSPVDSSFWDALELPIETLSASLLSVSALAGITFLGPVVALRGVLFTGDYWT